MICPVRRSRATSLNGDCGREAAQNLLDAIRQSKFQKRVSSRAGDLAVVGSGRRQRGIESRKGSSSWRPPLGIPPAATAAIKIDIGRNFLHTRIFDSECNSGQLRSIPDL
jgi:hypothetical protein